MKRLFALFVAAICTMSMWAHDFEVDGIYYNILTHRNHEVEVTYRGSFSLDFEDEYSGSVTIPETVTYNGTTYKVTWIGAAAFSRCSGLTDVTIPNRVMFIEAYAFDGCSSLMSVEIPNSVWSIGNDAFFNCKSLTSITIPESVIDIGYNTFSRCTSLTSITFYSPQLIIGTNAFYQCTSLTSITCFTLTPPQLHDNTFSELPIEGIVVFVPEVAVEEYKSTPIWQDLYIIGQDFVISDLENIGLDNGYGVMGNRKFLRHGQIVIIRDGVEYNALGQTIKE